jgi:hypothetical protein
VPSRLETLSSSAFESPIQGLTNRTSALDAQGETGGAGFPRAIPWGYGASTLRAESGTSSGDTRLLLDVYGYPYGAFLKSQSLVEGAAERADSATSTGVYFLPNDASGSWPIASFGWQNLGAQTLYDRAAWTASLTATALSTSVGSYSTIPTPHVLVTDLSVAAGDVIVGEHIVDYSAVMTSTAYPNWMKFAAMISDGVTSPYEEFYVSPPAPATTTVSGFARIVCAKIASVPMGAATLTCVGIYAGSGFSGGPPYARVVSSRLRHYRPL